MENKKINMGKSITKNQKLTGKSKLKCVKEEDLRKINGGLENDDDFWTCHNCGASNLEGTKCPSCGEDRYHEDGCISEGTQILMADGTCKAVEDLRPHDLVASWDFDKGVCTSAELLYNAHAGQEPQPVTVSDLHFSDGSVVSIIQEHGFFDLTLGRFVTIGSNASEFTGHDFVHMDKSGFTAVKLTDVTTQEKTLRYYSPIAKKTLCLITNGMLSVADCLPVLLNSFAVDPQALRYTDKETDTQKYGLLSYETVKSLVSEEEFEAFGGPYVGIALGKGSCSIDQIKALLETYAKDMTEIKSVLK